jgi:large subunit ribosomal protein L15
MKLNEIQAPKGANHDRKRLGRGHASGQGKTAGKGHKGQKARAGKKVRIGFEGGQMPLARRLPKFGFTNIFRKNFAEINLVDLERLDSADVNIETLTEAGMVRGHVDGIKILGNGEIERAVNITADRVSAGAREKIEKAGGSVTLIVQPEFPVEVDAARIIRKLPGDVVTLDAILAAKLAPEGTERVRVVKRGIMKKTNKTFKGLLISRQAKRAIQAVGGKIEEIG